VLRVNVKKTSVIGVPGEIVERTLKEGEERVTVKEEVNYDNQFNDNERYLTLNN